MAPTPVLATKLFAPTPRPHLVARSRLAERLDTTLTAGHRLTLIAAPAGFGKTTLLSDWIATQRSTDLKLAWLSLDDGDNDLARLLTHIGAALETGDVETPVALINDIANEGTRWLLILDDYHVITAPDVHDAMTFLLDHLPDQLRLVMATRSDPPLPLARLRTRGQLTEIRAADLRFTRDEAREFLNQVMGLELTAADINALEARTEGWVAGLQLAALSLRGIAEREAVEGFIEAFTGSNRFVIDYLADEVLARQSGPVREFLLRTAILERFTGSLCEAVTGSKGGEAALEDLERANLFIVALDEHRSWYRYHHLFADVLRARLLAEKPEMVAELHRRACEWYRANGLIADAVRHALAGEDFARAAFLMEEALPELRRGRQDALLLGWIRSLPEPTLKRSPVLSVLSAWSLMMSGDLDAADSRLGDAENALADEHDTTAWADTDELRTAPATISIYRASLAQARGDVAGTVHNAQRAINLAGPEDHLVRGAANGFLGLAAWAAGNVQQALTTFGSAVRSLHAAGNLVDELDSTIVLADMWMAAGRPSQARRLFEQALRSATEKGEPYPRATADLHVGLAELDRELDDLTSAEAHLETARILGERGSITENRHRWFVAMAQVHAARGDHDGALRLLDRAETIYRHGFYPDVRPISAMKARLQIAAGALSSATAWVRDFGAGYLHEYEHLTVARLLLAQHRAPEALALLDRLHTEAAGSGRDGSLLEIRTLKALAHHANHDLKQAIATLEISIAETPEPRSYVRLYLDEGPPMQALLHAKGPLDPLSPRELQVLRLLDSELTGPEIARQLYVSLNTLRTHTKRIFTKLDATTRAGAVRRARERGLL